MPSSSHSDSIVISTVNTSYKICHNQEIEQMADVTMLSQWTLGQYYLFTMNGGVIVLLMQWHFNTILPANKSMLS